MGCIKLEILENYAQYEVFHCIVSNTGSNMYTQTQCTAYDPWGKRRNPTDWSYNNVPTTYMFDRGYTGHEMLDAFGLINMNGRVYDPLIARFLSPDNFVQDATSTQNFNRYSYCLNNPLVYTDPSGEFWHLVIGAAIGGTFNLLMNLDNIDNFGEGLAYFGIGAVAGALGAGVGVGIQTASAGASFWAGFVGSSQGISTILSVGYTSSFVNGALAGAGGGFAGGFTTGFGNGLMQGQPFGQAAWSGTKAGFWGGVSGAAIGGISGGIDAELDNKNFWTGGEKAKVYRSPVGDNFGSQNGECALRCFEEFSDSYGMNQYDYDYWFKQNGSKLGVKPGELEGIVDGTGVFSSDRIMPEANSIAKAFSNGQRVLMGFNTDNGGAHAVMVNRVKIWPSGQYRIWFAETSPVRIAPYSTSNIFNLGGVGFWTFFPR